MPIIILILIHVNIKVILWNKNIFQTNKFYKINKQYSSIINVIINIDRLFIEIESLMQT